MMGSFSVLFFVTLLFLVKASNGSWIKVVSKKCFFLPNMIHQLNHRVYAGIQCIGDW